LSSDGFYSSFFVPLRARVWFMDTHSPLVDLGVGARYLAMTANAVDDADADARFDYTRDSLPVASSFGVGYGYRPYGPHRGYRLTALVGGATHLSPLGASESSTTGGFGAGPAAALSNRLDTETAKRGRPKFFAELSFGLMF
jgi:hypothetical protein